MAQAAIEANKLDQALIHIEQARTALHPEGAESTARCEYLAALCFFGMYDLPHAKERLAEAWKLSPIGNALDKEGAAKKEDDEIIQCLLRLTKEIKGVEDAGGFSDETEPMPTETLTEILTAPEPEALVMNFNEAVEIIKADAVITNSQLRAIRDAINFALSDESTQLGDEKATRHLARGLLAYCDWRLDQRPIENLSTLILERRALRRLLDYDFEEILVDCILETPLTWLQRCRYKLRLIGIEFDRKGLVAMILD